MVSVSEIRKAYNPDEKAVDDDFFTVRYLVRPLSFYVAAWFASLGISANGATWISLACGMAGSFLLGFGGQIAIIGAALLLLWNLLDHVDGNLARYHKKPSQYGDYLDTIACYFVLAFFPIGAGMGAFNEFPDHPWSVLIPVLGGIGAIGGILPRLLYQKLCSYGVEKSSYQNDMQDTDATGIANLKRHALRFANNILNPSGLLFFALLLAAILHQVPVFVLVYAGLLLLFMLISTIRFLQRLKAHEAKHNTKPDLP